MSIITATDDTFCGILEKLKLMGMLITFASTFGADQARKNVGLIWIQTV